MARRVFEGPLDGPSKLACMFILQRWARLLPTARLGEHRHPTNTIGLVCAFGEQRKLPSLPIHYFAEPSSDRAMPSYPSLSRGDRPPPYLHFWCVAVGEHKD